MSLYVVTGGASGIGNEVVVGLRRTYPDAHVAVLDRASADITDDRVMLFSADVRDRVSVFDAFDRMREWAGSPLAGLVCCAGVQRRVPSLELGVEDWSTVLGIHLDGTLWACQAAATQMNDNGGAIVTFSSISERFAWPERLPYAVAKAGIGALTRTLALEWAPLSVRVNAIAPGYVNTPMVRSQIDAGNLDEKKLADMHALSRLAEPDEIARAAIFLLSDDASFITGETLFVDGGYSVTKSR